MLRSVKDMTSYTIAASDGDLGSVHDLYFDDEAWVVRYLVLDTRWGKWLPGRLVLISPISVNQPDWVSRRLSVSLTRQQIKDSPTIDTDRPVSRRKELQYAHYYGFPPYWGAASLWGPAATPAEIAATSPGQRGLSAEADLGNEATHLRSCREVAGYALKASDGNLGHIETFSSTIWTGPFAMW
jgi:hypothetical protein